MINRRVLVVTESLGFGGTETHLIRLLPQLSAAGLEIVVFCLSSRGERADQLEANGIEVRTVSRLPGWKQSSRRHPVHVVRAGASLFSFMRRWQPGLVHFYLPGPYVVGGPIALAQRIPAKVMSRRSLSNYQ